MELTKNADAYYAKQRVKAEAQEFDKLNNPQKYAGTEQGQQRPGLSKTLDTMAQGAAEIGRHVVPFGNDVLDTVGSGIATAAALPHAISQARSTGGAQQGQGILDTAVRVAPDVYRDIKGTVDMKGDAFKEELTPQQQRNLRLAGLGVGVAAGGVGALKGVGGAWRGLKREVIDDVGGLARAIRGIP
jgi:hypothetical protein